MAYADYGKYVSLYGQSILSEADFNRLLWDADKIIDNYTTGVDGIQKLRYAFPCSERDTESIIRCACSLIHLLSQIEEAEKNAVFSKGIISGDDGTVKGRVITSVSSGTESISYSASGTGASRIDAAAASEDECNKLFYSTVRKYLSGAKDANGVNLLYMGVYPRVC